MKLVRFRDNGTIKQGIRLGETYYDVSFPDRRNRNVDPLLHPE